MSTDPLKQQILAQCALADRGRLLRLYRRSRQRQASSRDEAKLTQAVERSIAAVERRRQNRPRVRLNRELPFYQHRDELHEVIAANQVVIVCGETGSGKTTQLPQICLDLGLADRGRIGHTQPRRLAARSVSARIAEELGTVPGDAVGYKVRFSDTIGPDAYVKLMTDGILLAEIQHDRWLDEYQTLIIDEAHERSLNIDLLLGYVKTLLPRRPDLKLIITSATIDPARFSRYFDDAPMVSVSGRTYPVELRYRPIVDEEQKDRDRAEAVMDALDELFAIAPEDTLVFFPGERQIREAAERIRKRFHQYDVLPLYARLGNAQQQRIFKPGGKRRIILSTNVAETSLTVPGIRYVIDTGLARISRYSWRAKVQRLPIEKISQASASQRAGRCGRVAPGICVRLYDEEDFAARAEFTEPEILRTNLASVILQMDALRVGHIREFDFIDPPDSRLIGDGYRLLHELEAVEDDDTVTPLGKSISRLPVDPRLARMLLAASDAGCLAEVLVIAAVLSVRDPRDASPENRQAANEKFRQWQNDKSDFLGWLELWQEIGRQQKALSRNRLARWCRSQYLSWLRVREWQDIYRQLRAQAQELRLRWNSAPATGEQIHRAILKGIPSHIAVLDEDRVYQTTRGRQALIFPASVLAKKTPKWIMAFSLIDTGRLYAHDVAAMQPQWAMSDLAHLHQYEYLEPHWQEKQGRVAALRNTRIYGLLIEGGKRINYAAIDPKTARAIFIREALVEGRYQARAEFIAANRELVEACREQEARERRRDLLVGDEALFEFYDHRVPAGVVDGPSFESWAKSLGRAAVRNLTLSQEDVLATEHEKDTRAWPEYLNVREQRLRLSYVFDPADEADGVSVWIPLAVLNQFDDADFDFLVPGLLEEKVQALIRSLPKPLRKHFIPAPEYARACVESMRREQPFYAQLSAALRRMTGVEVAAEDWRPDAIDAHFRMRYCLERDGECIASGRSLTELKQRFGGRAQARFEAQAAGAASIARDGLSAWDFDSLPEQVRIEQDRSPITAFPALVDYQESVSIELFETREDAAFYHSSGAARLIAFALGDAVGYFQKNMPQRDQSALMYVSMGGMADLVDDIVIQTIIELFLDAGLPRDRAAFERLLEQHRGEFLSRASDKAELVFRILALYRQTRERMAESKLPDPHRADIEQQCEHLVYAGFVRHTPGAWLARLPAYFQALQKRIDKSERDLAPADRVLPLIRELWQSYLEIEASAPRDAEKLEQLRWMLEEFRVGCFAQPMKTRMPVSEQRLRRLIDELS